MSQPHPLEGVALPRPATARAIRERAGWSRQRMADRLGVHIQTLICWELGTRGPAGARRWVYADLLAELDQQSRREAAG